MKKIVLLAASVILFTACRKTSAPVPLTSENKLSIIAEKESPAVTDIDGNVYKSVTIGTQVWMKKNLKVTRFRNGDKIRRVTDVTAGNHPKKAAYSNYNNDAGNVNTYGRLYNWYAVTDIRNIAPEGWHVPTDAEWSTLITYLGGEDIAGGKLKEAGLAHWLTPNGDADNSSGFTGLPGGELNYDGVFKFTDIGVYEPFWTFTAADAGTAWSYDLIYTDGSAKRVDHYKLLGEAVRCIKD